MSKNRFPYPEGSIWRKWDLHIHGPETKLNNQFSGKGDDEKWENYVRELEKYNLEGIAYTNYFCIDGLEKLKAIKDSGKLKTIKTILPNIEFRLAATNKDEQCINIHVIFSDEVPLDNINSFLTGLPLTNTCAQGKPLFCCPTDLLAVGYEKATINEQILISKLAERFNANKDYFLVLPCNGFGSIRASVGNGRNATLSNELDKSATFFFGTNDNRSHYLSRDRFNGAIPKAVVSGSDAHKLEAIGCHCTWIKADPTFNGLRQIIFEPSERVSLTSEKPHQRAAYTIIKSLRFADNTGKNKFESKPIPINPKLTAIIGGKSTGKSLLIFYATKAIDVTEVENRSNIRSQAKYDFESDADFDFEVNWQDGISQNIRAATNISGQRRQIVYIPQTFLNRISEDDGDSQEILNKFVLSVLLQDKTASGDYENHLREVQRLDTEIAANSDLIFRLKQEESALNEQLKNLGDPNSIMQYIAEIDLANEKILAKSELSEFDSARLKEFSAEESNLSIDIRNIENDIKLFATLKQNLDIKLSEIKSTIDGVKTQLNLESSQTKLLFLEQTYSDLRSKNVDSFEKCISGSNLEKAEIEGKRVAVEQQLKPLKEKASFSLELSKYSEIKKLEVDKLSNIEAKTKAYHVIQNNLEELKISTKSKIKGVLESYASTQSKFKEYEGKLDEILLNIQVHLKSDEFLKSLNECVGKADARKLLGNLMFDDGLRYSFNSENHLILISSLLDSACAGSIKLLKNKSISEFIQSIARNRYKLDFKITYKGDSLSNMSPGKKGLTLLRLLVDLSEQQWPILLDQPEDDLDNRSVYSELVGFIRKKKNERQIIIVTHNPNLVVGADAEQIIVANQTGQDAKRDNKTYQFEYVSGSIENTFNSQEADGILNQMGIREHVCEILEGGNEAFKKREAQYHQ
jgi:hypothetical protein